MSELRVIKATAESTGRQHLEYFVGISPETCGGATSCSSHLEFPTRR